jgi:cystathionine beta-lyase
MADDDGTDDAGAVHPDTWAATAGRRRQWTGTGDGRAIVNPPVWRASTILYPSVAAMEDANRDPDGALFYGRKGTPTTWALREALNGLEPGAAGTMLFPSGVAALSCALLTALKPGDHLLITDSAYDPTSALAFGLLARMGVEAEAYDPLAGAGIAALIRPNTGAILVESPGSLTFEVQDVPAIAAAAQARDIPVILDNTWSASHYFKGLKAGCAMVVQALTKYVGGHSDAMMGSITADSRWFERMRTCAWVLGQCVSGDDAALVLRGFRTLPLRLERQQQTGLALARWLASHPLVDRVLHPALPSCPGHALWQRDFTGASGLFAAVLKVGSRADAALFCDGLRQFGLGYSWGGYESLLIPTAPERLRRVAPPPGGGFSFRISAGLEDPADLIADLEAALGRMAARYPS